MSYVSFGMDVRDLRASYRFYVEELRCFRLGGTRFYGDAGLDGMIRQGEMILEWIATPGVEIMMRPVEQLPARIGSQDAMVIEVPRIEAELRRLKNAPLASGARVLSENLLATPHGSTFWMLDPSGYRIQLLSAASLHP